MTTASTILTPQSDAPSCSVLVVEDEVLTRFVIADYLRECGYRVYEAVDAGEAVAILQSTDVSIDIVFSDVQIPGDMDGFGLARWIRSSKPNVHVILTSGVERSAEIAATLCEAGPLLEKPYPHQSVVDRIKQLVAKAKRS